MYKSAAISRFRELKEKKTPKGRHFLFEMRSDDGYIGYLVNRIPYNGDIITDPGKMYGLVKDYGGEPGKKVGSYVVNWNAVDRVLGGEDTGDAERVDLTSTPVADPPEELKKQVQPDLLGLVVEEVPKKWNSGVGHWASTVVADTWTKGQVYCSEDGCYDVGRLLDEVKYNEVVPTKVSKLSAQLKENSWGEDESPLSPFDVMSAPTSSEVNMKHMAKIRTADLSKPILIRLKDGVVIDGNHRLARSVMEGRDRINSVYVQEEQMAKAKI
jgi:hypothetical protein